MRARARAPLRHPLQPAAQAEHQLVDQRPSGREACEPDQTACNAKIKKCDTDQHGFSRSVSNRDRNVHLRRYAVRPTDENQAGSTRPNLMSSRRGAGEENILAMLERDSARRNGSRMSGVRLAWYGAAAALAGVLAGGIAWLAWDNHKGVQELQARH